MLLILIVAAPVVASSAGYIGSYQIKDNSILNRDIRQNVISSSRIKDGTLLNRDIDENVISSSRIRNGTIRNRDVNASAAIADSKIAYSTKTKVLSVSSQAFIPREEGYDFTKVSNSLYMQGSSGAFSAPVYLPQGATVTELKVVAEDNSGGSLTGYLYRRTGSVSGAMAGITTNGAVAGWRTFTDSTVSEPVINNNDYAYFVLVGFGVASPSLELDRVIIKYLVAGP
jgi:hypothetical protein